MLFEEDNDSKKGEKREIRGWGTVGDDVCCPVLPLLLG